MSAPVANVSIVTDTDAPTTMRVFYDAIGTDHAARHGDQLASNPHDRAVPTLFTEMVWAGGGGPVVDVGCGLGWVTRQLAGLAPEMSGADLSSFTVAAARQTHPGPCFDRVAVRAGRGGRLIAWARRLEFDHLRVR